MEPCPSLADRRLSELREDDDDHSDPKQHSEGGEDEAGARFEGRVLAACKRLIDAPRPQVGVGDEEQRKSAKVRAATSSVAPRLGATGPQRGHLNQLSPRRA